MAAHVARGHVARIDRRIPAGERHEKGRLRPLQMEGDLVIAIGGDRFEVPIPGLAGINAELFARLPSQEVKGALDILGREGLGIVPSHPLAKWQCQVGPILVP